MNQDLNIFAKKFISFYGKKFLSVENVMESLLLSGFIIRFGNELDWWYDDLYNKF